MFYVNLCLHNCHFLNCLERNEGNLFGGTTCKSIFQVKCVNTSQLSFEEDSDSLPLEFEKTDPNSYICRTWVSTQKIPPWWRACGFPPGGLCIWSHTLKHRKHGNRFQRTSWKLEQKTPRVQTTPRSHSWMYHRSTFQVMIQQFTQKKRPVKGVKRRLPLSRLQASKL